jgi:dUTP pyrophosphatase
MTKFTTKTKVKIHFLNKQAKMPVCGSKYSAGYDLHSICDELVTIGPHETVKMKTGIAMEIPEGYFGAIFARSGIATKRGLRPANCTGVIDSDYRGELIVALHNDTDQLQFVEPGERIAQLVIMPYLSVEFEASDSLNETQRGDRGFGSTGTV